MSTRKLNERESKFCYEYMKDFNGKQAAIRAGYSKKTAGSKASQLLTKISVTEKIKIFQDKANEKSELTREDLVRELQNIFLFDPSELFDDNGKLIPIHDLPVDVRKVIQEISETQLGIKKVKLYSKLDAIEKVAKHLGFYEKDNTQKIQHIQIELVRGTKKDETQSKD